MAFKHKKSKPPLKLTRKQQRKEKRKQKKTRRDEFFSKKKLPPGTFVKNPEKPIYQNENDNNADRNEIIRNSSSEGVPENHNKLLTTEQVRKIEKKKQKRIELDMKNQRNKQLLEANKEEDRIIKQMEKQLGLKKRKSKSFPKSFAEDGLGYLLEIVDPEYLKHGVATEQGFDQADGGFEEDFALMTDKPLKKNAKVSEQQNSDNESEFNELDQEDSEFDDKESDNDGFNDETEEVDNNSEESDVNEASENSDKFSDELDNSEMDFESDEEVEMSTEQTSTTNKLKKYEMSSSPIKIAQAQKKGVKDKASNISDSEDITNTDSEDDNVTNEEIDNCLSGTTKSLKRTAKSLLKTMSKKQKIASPEQSESEEGEEDSKENTDESDSGTDLINEKESKKGAVKQFVDGTWEDIYGRLRGEDGSIITSKTSKYVPPAMRDKIINEQPDKKRIEKLNRLRKQLKGLLNRLAESNMHSIASQIESLYMNNSRNDMNDTMTNLIMESLVAEVITPERLLIEHVVLLTILHANVGTEVGAHFLQYVIRKFEETLISCDEVENKTLDNIVRIIAQLYNFKLFDSKLIYEVLQKLARNFEEKDVECILHVLRSVGFSLRKDDPLALKSLILDLQNKAAKVSVKEKDNTRVKFMLDILLAIKNNNVSKIPNYDVSYSEHLKKGMKGFIRKGNYVTELNISLEDLLKADERGRWWVVGSAWTGTELENNGKSGTLPKDAGFSSKLLEIAKKQRMNTDARRNIFCIIMSAEDYMDAFEKLLKLGLKNTQEREIINVILHCCLQEKQYNPYYGHLAQKFCDYDRRYQMSVKYSIWDKIKTINEHSGSQMSNLAKLLIHLFIEKGLPISTLKIMQFSELDKITLRFTRQILLGILLHRDLEACLSVFSRVSQSEKLKLFRESLRLFIHHFLLRNLKSDKVPEEEKSLLETRAKMVERVLTSKEVKVT